MEIAALHKEIKPSGLPLDQPARNSRVSEEQKIHETCGQFEAVLLRQILAKAQKPLFQSHCTLNSSVNTIYQDMTIAQLADSLSKAGSLGLARNLEEQLARQLAKKTAQDPMTGQISKAASLP